MKKILEDIKREIKFYQLLLKDERIPKSSKWLLGVAIGYAVSPIDIIPDFIPILGQLDDLLIVPTLIWFAVKRIPKNVIDECRAKARDS